MSPTPPELSVAAPLSYGRQRFQRSAFRRWMIRVLVGLSVPAIAILSVATPLVWQWHGDSRTAAVATQLGGSVTTHQVGTNWIRDRVPSRFEVLFGRVKDVSLRDLKVNDDDIACFSRLTDPVDIDLYMTDISDRSLLMIRTLASVDSLHLGRTHVTDDAVWLVKDMPNLTYLGFQGANITDAGLVHIGKLPKLQTLRLTETNVTDAGLVYLQRCPHLTCVYLEKTRVTEKGVQALQAAKPDLCVRWDGEHIIIFN